MQPDWTLIANATRARLLQQERGAPMVILESFVHPRGRGKLDAASDEHIKFARELAHLLEQEAQLDHFHSLTIFASSPFLGEIRDELGKATLCRLTSTHELDLTHLGLSELEERIARELAPLGDLIH
jgi:protein required for attachment to host cells